MEKYKEIIAGIIIAAAIIIHGFITAPVQSRYEVKGINNNNWVIIDHKTGEIYRQYIEENAGPTEWRLVEMPNE